MTKRELWEQLEQTLPVHMTAHTPGGIPAPGSVMDLILDGMLFTHNDLERQLHDCLLQVATLKEELKAIQEPDVDDRRKR